jgi:hypothetical protein
MALTQTKLTKEQHQAKAIEMIQVLIKNKVILVDGFFFTYRSNTKYTAQYTGKNGATYAVISSPAASCIENPNAFVYALCRKGKVINFGIDAQDKTIFDLA